MYRFLLIISILLLNSVHSYALANQDSLTLAIKMAILNGDLETALIHLPSLKANDQTKKILQKQANYKDLQINDYVEFLGLINQTPGINVLEFSQFIDQNISTPSQTEKLNYDYVLIKWQEITWLVDDSEFDKAAIEQNKLESYILNFDPENRDVKRAKILEQTYHMVMLQIQGDALQGLEVSKELEKIALTINDTNLLLLARYYHADFLINVGNLDTFIDLCESSLKIEEQRSKKSPYYIGTIFHLIDAYLYKENKTIEVYQLLLQLIDDPTVGAVSYSYIVNFLEKITIPSAESDTIFSRFGVTNIPEFCIRIDSLAKDQLNTKEYYYVLFKLSRLNEAHGDGREALLYLHDANIALKKTYNTDLAESLAKYETTLLKNSQEQHLEREKQKSELFIVISILSLLLFLITSLLFWQRNKKGNLLKLQNIEITQQRDNIKERDREKAILLKEIHHRVKNNFQVISSLLELQSAGIEDETALRITEEGKNRINSMALIHKKLYQNDDLIMYFDEYIDKLSQDLFFSYGKDKTAKLELNIPHIAFDLDTAIPLGLILNELITNALKYGMDNKKPLLSISITQKDSTIFELKVQDNGKGIAENMDVLNMKSLGLQLVTGLSKQLQGEMACSNDNGALFTVTFKDTYTRSLID